MQSEVCGGGVGGDGWWFCYTNKNLRLQCPMNQSSATVIPGTEIKGVKKAVSITKIFPRGNIKEISLQDMQSTQVSLS